MKTIGLIPARGGSKRVKNKNIRLLNGVPLIVYTIKAAINAENLDRVIVSTDNLEIAKISKNAGAEVPFVRPPELALDNTPDKPVIINTLDWLQKNEDYLPDAIAILRPTTPFKTPELIDSMVQLLAITRSDSVRSVTPVEGVHHPYWMYKQTNDHKAIHLFPEHTTDKYFQRQMLPPIYRLNGLVDVVNAKIVKNHCTLYGDDITLKETPEQYSLDIDTEMDFKMCEFFMNELSNI